MIAIHKKFKSLLTEGEPSEVNERPVIPIGVFAGELVRLAKTVKENVDKGLPSVQTISQLNAMEPIIGLLRAAGLESITTDTPAVAEKPSPGYL
jgi:hypothetical protein